MLHIECSISNYHQPWYYIVLPLLFLISEQPSLAGDWSLAPTVYIAGSYNNNIFLSPPGRESRDSILQVNPAISIDGKGGRGNGSLYYEMQNIFYRKNSEFNDTYHNLNARAQAELLPEMFFVDATLGRTQQIISRDASIPVDNVTISANRTNVNIASVSPFVRTNLGNKLTTEVRYSSAWTRYDQDTLPDARNQTVYADLRNNLTSSRSQWGIIYSNRKFEPDNGLNSSYERTYVDIDYLATGQLGLLASAGYENNEYNRGATTRIEKGSTWDIGFRWSPRRQNILSIRVGERVFGRTRSLDFRYLTHRWTWSAGYGEEFRNNVGILVRNQQNDDADGKIILPGDPTPTTEVYLSRNFDFKAIRSYGKTDINLSIYDRKREFQLSGEEERISGGEAVLDWRIQKRTSIMLAMQLQNQKLRDGFSDDDLITGTVGVNREIFRDANLKFDFRHYRRNSNNSARSIYRQNQITLGLTVIF